MFAKETNPVIKFFDIGKKMHLKILELKILAA